MIRVTLSGVESVGKSTLAAALAAQFGGRMVTEFGRSYTEALDRPLTLADHHAIAEAHARAAAEAAAARPRLLVEDSDIVMTTAWARMLFAVRDPLLAARPSMADLHLLLLPDVPFVADRVRLFGDAAERRAFHALVVDEYRARGIPFVPIGGNWDARAARAVAALAALSGMSAGRR